MKRKLLFMFNIWFMMVIMSLFVYHEALLAGITGKISGIVKDVKTNAPLPGVNIVIEETNLGAATDANGNYFILNIPPGTYSLKASIIGYEGMTKTGVLVSVDHTTTINFDLKETTIAGQEVTVVAEREIIPMDVSASQIVSDGDQVIEVPLITDVSQYISLQAGIVGDNIRGGGLDQTEFMLDGLTVVDNRTNQPVMMVNLSAISEVSIIKGGFNAEYGNVRSGLINIVTKDGSPSVYHGSVDYRISPPHLKHSGTSLFSPDNWQLRPYLDPDVCWGGTNKGTWDAETQRQNLPFIDGWNGYSAKLLEDDDPSNDMTPQEAHDLFLWQHAAEGSGALGQKEGKYGNKPDWNTDISFGGPVPLIGKRLGNLSFFTSYRDYWDAFALPVYRDYYKEDNLSLKLTSRVSSSMKLTLEGTYGKVNSVAMSVQSGGGGPANSGSDVISVLASDWPQNLYYPSSLGPFDVYRTMQGLSFDHVLSPSTFYNIRLSHVLIKNDCAHNVILRDKTPVRKFGNVWVNEVPYGAVQSSGEVQMADGMNTAAHCAGAIDLSEVNTLNAKFDLTSQVDRYNQLKTGFILVYDDLNTHYEHVRWESMMDNWQIKWSESPYRIGAYVQDKLEFEGMIANFGVRMDYNQPNGDYFSVGDDRYSKYFKKAYKADFLEVAPRDPAKSHIKISPRLGISHPISENAKLYFNYGHFYSMPTSDSMYRIQYGQIYQGVIYLGNPSANLPRTTSYELGWEYNIANLFLVSLSGYYKDVGDQTGGVTYTSYDGTINYTTTENNNYQDIRGFELRLERRYGRFITGWLNYTYVVTTSGYVGRLNYYEDPRQQQIKGLQDPYQEIPLARPILRAFVSLRTPPSWGPSVGGINPFGNINVSSTFNWRAGSYTTWDPLQTYKLKQNLQWKANYTFDARFSKRIRYGKYTLSLFADVNNLFNYKMINSLGFQDSDDSNRYYSSLHLPMYAGPEYQAAGIYTAGNDRPGDRKSNEKPYIDMPNRDYLTYLDLRTVFFGIKIDF